VRERTTYKRLGLPRQSSYSKKGKTGDNTGDNSRKSERILK